MGMKWSKAISIAESKQEDGQYEKAITYFKKALEIARSNGSKEEEARTLDLLAGHYKSMENYHEAVDYYNKGLTIAQETGDKELECRMCMHLVYAYKRLAQYNDEMKYSKEGLNIALRTVYSEAIAYFYCHIGLAYDGLYEYENSIEWYNKAIDIYKQLEHEKGLAACYENLSISYSQQAGKYNDAIHFQEESLRINDEMGNKLAKAKSLLNFGNIHWTLKNTEKAAELYHQSLTIAEEIGDKGLQAVCHEAQLKVSQFMIEWSKVISVAESKQKDGQYDEAITYFKKALEIARSNGSKEEETRTLDLLAEHYNSIEKYHEAVDYYKKGLPIAQETGDQVLECKMFINLGGAYNQLGQYNDVMTYSKQDLDIALKTGDSKLVALSYRNLAGTYDALYEYENSMKCYNKAIHMYKQLEDEEGLAVCYHNLSISYKRQGMHHDAIHFQKESLRIYDEMGNKLAKAKSLLNLAKIHWTLKNTEKAAELYHQSLTIAEEIGDKGIQADCHEAQLKISESMKRSKAISVAELKQEDGQYEKAITYFKKALENARSNGSKEEEVRTLNLLAVHYKSMENYHEAVDYYKKGLQIAQETGDQELECNMCINLGSAYNQLGQYNDVITYSKQGLDIALRTGDSKLVAPSYRNLAGTYDKLCEYENSMECHNKAIDMCKQLEDEEGLAVCYHRLSISYKRQGKYHDAIHVQEESLRIYDKMGNKLGKAKSLYKLGNMHWTLKNTEKAAELYHQSLTIAEEIGDKGLQADCHEAQLKVSESMKRSKGISVAESKQEDGQYEKAITYFKKALEKAKVKSLIKLGNIHRTLKNTEKAAELYHQSLTIAEEIGDEGLQAACHEAQLKVSESMKRSNAIAVAELKQEDGQYEKAITYFKKALENARNNGSKEEETRILDLLAEHYNSIEKYHEAVDYYNQGLLVAQETGDQELECNMCINLAGTYDELHKYENSMECYNKAIDMYKQLEDEEGLAVCYCNLSLSYKKQGKYHDAILFLEESLRIKDKMGNKLGKAKSLINLGNIHHSLTNMKKAQELYQQSLTIAKEIDHKGLQASCHMDLGNILDQYGNHQDAISCYLESLKIAEQLDDKLLLAAININLGNCYKCMNQYQEAHKYYNNGLIIAKEIDAKDSEALVYYNLAVLRFDKGEFQQAISILEKSLHIALSIGNRQREGNAWYLLGKAYYSLVKHNQEHETRVSSMTKSEEYLKNALVCFDYLFSQLQRRDHLKISIFDSFMKTYKLLTTVYIETQQTQQALLVSDHGRARALGDRLIFKYGISQEEYLSSQPLTYPDVGNVLSNDAFTLLHYSLLDQSLAVWVVFKDSIEFKHTDKQQFVSAVETLFGEKKKKQEDTINRFFTDTVARAYEDMKITEGVKCENRSLDDSVTPKDKQCEGVTQSVSRDGTSVEDPGQKLMRSLVELYNALVAPVLSNVQHDEIVIVPDGKMYTVPFAALIDPNTGQYLSETKRIRLVPSIAILKVLQECPANHHSQQGALIVGNPSVGEVMFRGKKTTNFVDDLPHAQQEVKRVTILLRKASSRTANPTIISLTGKEATKDVVLTKLKEGVAIIHIAAHGNPDNGEIALAPIPSQDRQGIPEEEDYLLTMKEVQQVGIKAKLVVLSCCHSGQGEIRAEGVVGLSRAFLAAGARAVVASLWAVDDYVTLSFMYSFYECLCQGKSASVSLDKAMKDIRDQHRFSHPKYWAPFFLIGDDVTIKFEQ